MKLRMAMNGLGMSGCFNKTVLQVLGFLPYSAMESAFFKVDARKKPASFMSSVDIPARLLALVLVRPLSNFMHLSPINLITQ